MRLSVVLLMCLAGPAVSQQDPCPDAVTQAELNACAAQMFEAADGDLNLAYKLAMTAARDMDSYGDLSDGKPPAADMLRSAQRAWIAFRDAACAAESNLARGGSMQPMLELNCRERLTRQRTEDLRYFGEVN